MEAPKQVNARLVTLAWQGNVTVAFATLAVGANLIMFETRGHSPGADGFAYRYPPCIPLAAALSKQ